MTAQPQSWQAPRVFRTHRGAVAWSLDRNPYRPGAPAFFEWMQLFWRDQRDRGLARAERSAKLALALAIVAVVVNVLNVVLRLTGVLP